VRSARVTHESRFFSLKWKAVLIFSLVLIIVNAGLAGLGYQQLKQQFIQQQTHLRQQQTQELDALVSTSFNELEQIASLIPNMAPAFSAGEPMRVRLAKVFSKQSATLEFDWGLDEASYFSSDNELLFSWRPTLNIARFRSMIEGVNASERPDYRLDCLDQCRQYVAIPVLDGGKTNGALLLSRLISNVIISFNDITGADIAILTQEAGRDWKNTNVRLLPNWGYYVVALTDRNHNMSLLLDVSARYRFEDFLSSSSRKLDFEGGYYTLHSIQMNQDDRSNTHFLIINNITKAVTHINQATQKSLLFGLIGFLLSESLLLLLLWNPLKRLWLVSESLPLLAHNAYQEVRSKLGTEQRSWHKDEIDIAGQTTLELTHTLESLHNEIQQQTRNLIERGHELERERDFVTGLLNSAQVIILTQNDDGDILTINPEGRKCLQDRLEAGSEEKLNFFQLVRPSSDASNLRRSIEALKKGNLSAHQHDTRIETPGGEQISISWVHSRLHGKAVSGEALILSVGLDITDRERAEQRLAWLANHDPLTELHNRRFFQTAFEGLLQRASRYHHGVALLFFDLDQFKYVNDTSGHQAGDAMLRVVAERLNQLIRSSDLLARLGGDEFAVAIPESDVKAAIQVAEKILENLRQVSLPTKGRSHRVSASIGIVLYPDHGSNTQDLMSNADLSMYQAKESGRDRWHLFALDDQMREQMSERLTWKEKIEQALVDSAFQLYYQPILEIKTGRISHYEVLIRMREKDGSLGMPGHFIPIAERTGQIHSIDRFVLRETISQIANMTRSTGQEINLAINLSGRVVDDPELLPLLKQLLNLSGVKPQNLVFELTETATLADMASAEQLMRELRDLGCRFAMDDFGVGFSSFYYLRELPLDIVKIDGSFIRQLPSSPEDRIFVKALTQLASGLHKLTVAEFVEDAETLEMVRQIGVDYAQGYYIGKPQPHLLQSSKFIPAVDRVGDVG
jgi:diguanylate cyclase (GGDEF)-like protein/PAS domain S-box-containing protein